MTAPHQPHTDGIPEDIRQAAIAAYHDAGMDPVYCIAKAILAERNRHTDGWQPIETAPRDGRTFLGARGKEMQTTRYGFLNSAKLVDGREIMEYGFVANYSQWWPTHWQPLPKPPSTTQSHYGETE